MLVLKETMYLHDHDLSVKLKHTQYCNKLMFQYLADYMIAAAFCVQSQNFFRFFATVTELTLTNSDN